MIRFVRLIILPLSLFACAPPALYHKPGAVPAQIESNLTNCQVAALERVPRDIRTRYIPPQYAPYTYCDGRGYCYTRTRLVRADYTETYDANEGLRARVVEQCMAHAGYRPVALPQCDPDRVRAANVPAEAPQPSLDGTSCTVRLPSGAWRIVTPG
ncbi:hypothetical protein [Roseovarius sp. MBR-154]|jgi:hypothetical protein